MLLLCLCQALWTMDPKGVGEEQHKEFYRFIAQAYDEPRYILHYKTDAPLSICSIFYVPETVSRGRERGGGRALSCVFPLPVYAC